MLKKIRSLFAPKPYQQEAHVLYASLVEQSRQPFFYDEMEVEDTLDGRFDMIILHVFLASQRLKQSMSEIEYSQMHRALSEAFFADMDRNLREMGSSDTGVGKRVKKMSQAFYGRLQAYEEATTDAAKMKEALKRNLYRSKEVSDHSLNRFIEYIAMTLPAASS